MWRWHYLIRSSSQGGGGDPLNVTTRGVVHFSVCGI
jgi:hypothetical protein